VEHQILIKKKFDHLEIALDEEAKNVHNVKPN